MGESKSHEIALQEKPFLDEPLEVQRATIKALFAECNEALSSPHAIALQAVPINNEPQNPDRKEIVNPNEFFPTELTRGVTFAAVQKSKREVVIRYGKKDPFWSKERGALVHTTDTNVHSDDVAIWMLTRDGNHSTISRIVITTDNNDHEYWQEEAFLRTKVGSVGVEIWDEGHPDLATYSPYKLNPITKYDIEQLTDILRSAPVDEALTQKFSYGFTMPESGQDDEFRLNLPREDYIDGTLCQYVPVVKNQSNTLSPEHKRITK